jgi:hypothetical protein
MQSVDRGGYVLSFQDSKVGKDRGVGLISSWVVDARERYFRRKGGKGLVLFRVLLFICRDGGEWMRGEEK